MVMKSYRLFPNLKKIIFAKIAVSDEYTPDKGHKPESDIPQHQEQGRILTCRVASPACAPAPRLHPDCHCMPARITQAAATISTG